MEDKPCKYCGVEGRARYVARIALIELAKKYRREALAQGADPEDVQEIDDVLKLAEDI